MTADTDRSPDNLMLTPAMKLNRPFISKQYDGQIKVGLGVDWIVLLFKVVELTCRLCMATEFIRLGAVFCHLCVVYTSKPHVYNQAASTEGIPEQPQFAATRSP